MIPLLLKFSTVWKSVHSGGTSNTHVNLSSDFILSPTVSLVGFMTMKSFCTGKRDILEKLRAT